MAVAAVFGLVLAADPAGAAAPGFYEAEVEVADQSAFMRRRAARMGLERVLIRLSGAAPLPAQPLLREALSQPERYYDRYLFVADDRLKLFFTPSALLELIDQAKLPLWPLRRPPAIAWLALEANGARQIVRGGHPLAAALVAEAHRRGFEARLPLMDLRDQLRVQPAVVWGRSSLLLAEASRRNAALPRPDAPPTGPTPPRAAPAHHRADRARDSGGVCGEVGHCPVPKSLRIPVQTLKKRLRQGARHLEQFYHGGEGSVGRRVPRPARIGQP